MKKLTKQISKKYILNIKYGIEKTNHEYFSITGELLREATKREIKEDIDIEYINKKYYIHEAGGCIHDIILKHCPEFKDIVLLHLADINGAPMHAIENGFYHLKNGFNDIKIDNSNFKNKFCEYYRIPQNIFDLLNKITLTKNEYAEILSLNNVFELWRNEAKKVINKYELN